MKIIISPAKKMNCDIDSLPYQDLPKFLNYTERIMRYIKSLNFEEVKNLWKTNDNITKQNIQRFEDMDLTKTLTPAIFSYEGIQYQYIAPSALEDRMLDYLQKHLRILSGFYGVLKPMDGVIPYRLEMQAKIEIEVIDESHIIINLASKEYSRCIEKYLQKKDKYITCIFAELSNGRVVQKGIHANTNT